MDGSSFFLYWCRHFTFEVIPSGDQIKQHAAALATILQTTLYQYHRPYFVQLILRELLGIESDESTCRESQCWFYNSKRIDMYQIHLHYISTSGHDRNSILIPSVLWALMLTSTPHKFPKNLLKLTKLQVSEFEQ